jgi:hypothetical protein
VRDYCDYGGWREFLRDAKRMCGGVNEWPEERVSDARRSTKEKWTRLFPRYRVIISSAKHLRERENESSPCERREEATTTTTRRKNDTKEEK